MWPHPRAQSTTHFPIYCMQLPYWNDTEQDWKKSSMGRFRFRPSPNQHVYQVQWQCCDITYSLPWLFSPQLTGWPIQWLFLVIFTNAIFGAITFVFHYLRWCILTIPSWNATCRIHAGTMDISQKMASQIPNWSKRKGASLRKGFKKNERSEINRRIWSACIQWCSFALDVVCRCDSVFPISLWFRISTIYWIHAAIYFVYIYMYKRAGTSDILTFVYTTGLVVFWIDLCRNCVSPMFRSHLT